jgi:hypothetical protein
MSLLKDVAGFEKGDYKKFGVFFQQLHFLHREETKGREDK